VCLLQLSVLYILDFKLRLDTSIGILKIKLKQCKVEVPIERCEVNLMAVGSAGYYVCTRTAGAPVYFLCGGLFLVAILTVLRWTGL
jgi:hypothetical protein